jgi:hypothetical protein
MTSPRSTIFTPDQGMDWTRSSEWFILVSDLALAKPPFAPLGTTRETALKYLRQYVAGLAHVNVGLYLPKPFVLDTTEARPEAIKALNKSYDFLRNQPIKSLHSNPAEPLGTLRARHMKGVCSELLVQLKLDPESELSLANIESIFDAGPWETQRQLMSDRTEALSKKLDPLRAHRLEQILARERLTPTLAWASLPGGDVLLHIARSLAPELSIFDGLALVISANEEAATRFPKVLEDHELKLARLQIKRCWSGTTHLHFRLEKRNPNTIGALYSAIEGLNRAEFQPFFEKTLSTFANESWDDVYTLSPEFLRFSQ